jgi:hypothetical protein
MAKKTPFHTASGFLFDIIPNENSKSSLHKDICPVIPKEFHRNIASLYTRKGDKKNTGAMDRLRLVPHFLSAGVLPFYFTLLRIKEPIGFNLVNDLASKGILIDEVFFTNFLHDEDERYHYVSMYHHPRFQEFLRYLYPPKLSIIIHSLLIRSYIYYRSISNVPVHNLTPVISSKGKFLFPSYADDFIMSTACAVSRSRILKGSVHIYTNKLPSKHKVEFIEINIPQEEKPERIKTKLRKMKSKDITSSHLMKHFPGLKFVLKESSTPADVYHCIRTNYQYWENTGVKIRFFKKPDPENVYLYERFGYPSRISFLGK